MSTLAGCASETKLREAELAQLAELLPGRYDNVEQARAAGEERAALEIAIVPIYAKGLGKYAFYWQEMAAGDPLRVTGQQVIAFDVSPDDHIVQSLYQLPEPMRWRDAHLNPDLFKGMIPREDVRPMSGCELVWKKESEGFSGENDPGRCRITSRASGGTLNLELRTELAPGRFAISERSVDASGRRAQEAAEDSFLRFVKRAD